MVININEITNSSQINQAYTALKRKQESLNRFYAVNFRLGQKVEFISDNSRWNGEVESIGRTGRIKIKLSNNRYSHYTIGAALLCENLITITS